MSKFFFHNHKFANENNNKKELIQSSKTNIKSVVDINILLNRVKLKKKNEKKQKVIFFIFTISAVSIFGAFITMIK